MRHLFSWSRSASLVLAVAFLATSFSGSASAQKGPNTGSGGGGDVGELQPIDKNKKPKPKVVYKGYCCEKWTTTTKGDKETQEGTGCTQTEDGNKCTAGRELPNSVQGSWKDCGGATMEPDRTPGGGLSKETARVKDCTPR
jgi:hypothetical protein